MTSYLTPDLVNFDRDGFQLLPAIVADEVLDILVAAIEEAKLDLNTRANAAGVRHLLQRSQTVRRFAKSQPLIQIASAVLGEGARPVKAILFDKTPAANWYVTWHQDVTIAVKEKIDVPGFGPWSVKDDLPHVQPPEVVLNNMLSVRIHLDDCSEENGPIKFIPGSHKLGILEASEISDWRESHQSVTCPARRGDAILMRPLILHSSSSSTLPDHRRVLHIEFAGAALPSGLEWAEDQGL